nr:chemotaxis protein [uncultured Anaerotignum sp.]
MDNKTPKNSILLETGTNEIEIMQFTINGILYGINVAKVKEIIMSDKVKPVPHVHPAVEGIFKPRDILITVIDLPYFVTNEVQEHNEKDLFIITHFNNLHVAFRVHTVVGISRLSWKDIMKPDKTVAGDGDSITTGIAQCGGELVTILDFEKIVAEIAPETSIQLAEIEHMGARERNLKPIVLAEDSVLLAKIIKEALVKAGYVNIEKFNNGQEAWNYLSQISKETEEEDIRDKVSLIITDIEMPEMDGHRLTKLIKTNDKLKKVPVVIFSSLITPEMQIKGKAVGADEQLSKPEIGHLVEVMDQLLEER